MRVLAYGSDDGGAGRTADHMACSQDPISDSAASAQTAPRHHPPYRVTTAVRAESFDTEVYPGFDPVTLTFIR